jgi:SAM-dependent methyltransferase
VTTKVFAPNSPKTEDGLYIFPPDTAERRHHFIPDVRLHPAKANINLTRAIWQYVSEPGETIMDITAGTGTIMLAELEGRKVICIELSPKYHSWIQESKALMGVKSLVLRGDCRKLLPIPADHVLFSPPYGEALQGGGGIVSREAEVQQSINDYRDDPANLGNMKDFIYNQEMRKIYRLCFESLRPGGTLSIIIKDHIKKATRIPLGLQAYRMALGAGFEHMDWFQWKPPGNQFTNIKRSLGQRVVEEEHVIILRRPQ